MFEANENKANFCTFSKLKIGCLFKSLYLEKKHYPISNLFLIVLLYIVEAKKGCKKKSLNILSWATDLLKHEKLTVFKSFIMSKFNYCHVTWHFCN